MPGATSFLLRGKLPVLGRPAACTGGDERYIPVLGVAGLRPLDRKRAAVDAPVTLPKMLTVRTAVLHSPLAAAVLGELVLPVGRIASKLHAPLADDGLLGILSR